MADPIVRLAGAVADSYRNAERIGFGILMIAVALVMLAAELTHPPHGIGLLAQGGIA